ncbi:MAG: hypothetical protein JSU74_01850, partial [Candidatus Zixiibacteriota bacterium]
GLAPGEAVVTSGQFLLDSETRLSEAIHGAGGHAHGGHAPAEHSDDRSHADQPEKTTKPSDTTNSVSNHHQHGEHRDQDNQSKQVDDPYNIHTCPMPSHFHVLNYGPGQCPECGMELVPVTETDNAPVYVCPMPECGVATNEPGLCPVCNMHLKEYQPEASRD